MGRRGGGSPAHALIDEPGLARTSPPIDHTFSDAFTDWHAGAPVDLPTLSVSLLGGHPFFLSNLEVDTVPGRMVLESLGGGGARGEEIY